MAWFRRNSQRPVYARRGRSARLARGASGLLAAVTVAVVANGCLMVRDDEGLPVYDDWPYDQAVFETIDADQVLHTELGMGVGLFVEYATGGTWRLWTSCDTALTNAPCTIEAHVIADSTIGGVSTQDFEGYDSVDLPAADELWLYAETTYDTEVVEFQAHPGVSIELELWVDGYLDPGFLYWVGDGWIHEGAASTPLVLTPDRS